MSAQSTKGNTPRKRVNGLARKRVKGVVRIAHSNSAGVEVRDYLQHELTDHELEHAKRCIGVARDQIKKNRGRCGATTIDRRANREVGWAKKLLKDSARWSYNDLAKLVEALKRCEIERVTKALEEAEGCSEAELRRRYNDERNRVIAETRKPTGETVGDIRVTQGGWIPLEYDDWIVSQADQPTLLALNSAMALASFGQVIANATPAPRAAPILFEAEAVDNIAAVVAEYLADRNVIHGEPKAQFNVAYDALRKLFGESDGEGHSFRDRCRFAYLAQFAVYDPRAQERIEAQIAEWRENGRRIVPLGEIEPVDAPDDPRAWMKPFKAPANRMEIGLRVLTENGGTEFISAQSLQSESPREGPAVGAKRVQSEASESTRGQPRATGNPRKSKRP